MKTFRNGLLSFAKGWLRRDCFYRNRVLFCHHMPKRGNLGDLLCSPRHYFNFCGSTGRIAIIGGGVFADYGQKRMKQLGLLRENTVLWGIGVSQAHMTPSVIRGLDFSRSYLLAGFRDLDLVDEESLYLPCVSALHGMLDEGPYGERVLLFLNSDVKVTSTRSLTQLRAFAEEKGWDLLLNNCGETEFRNKFRMASTVITNSYHGAYWSLLSGRKCCVLGHSSKFNSLCFSLGLPFESMVSYEREDPGALMESLKRSFEGNCVKLEEHDEVLMRCRKKNVEFASRLIDLKICEDVYLRCPSATERLDERL